MRTKEEIINELADEVDSDCKDGSHESYIKYAREILDEYANCFAEEKFRKIIVFTEQTKNCRCDCTQFKCSHCQNSSNKGWNDCRQNMIDKWNAQK